MQMFLDLLDVVLHLDRYMGDIVAQYGLWTYAILFIIIFLETGIVITPFLPGDSLLFAAGAIVPICPSLNIGVVFLVIVSAAILGDTVNYHIGRWMGPKVFSRPSSRLLSQKHLERAQQFYEKHGGKTIVLARFIPVIRTFAPFVAGIGRMDYTRFLIYNIAGGVSWAAILVFAGYFFGQMPWVKNNFSLIVLAIIVISVLPLAIEWIRHRNEMRRTQATKPD
ncbi:MAG TPA: DedA family protein [Planctomycetota bacterium]|nr:DedA family protein [Planctomycetota bacterium]